MSIADEHHDFHTLLADVPVSRPATVSAFQLRELEVKGFPVFLDKEAVPKKLEEYSRAW